MDVKQINKKVELINKNIGQLQNKQKSLEELRKMIKSDGNLEQVEKDQTELKKATLVTKLWKKANEVHKAQKLTDDACAAYGKDNSDQSRERWNNTEVTLREREGEYKNISMQIKEIDESFFALTIDEIHKLPNEEVLEHLETSEEAEEKLQEKEERKKRAETLDEEIKVLREKIINEYWEPLENKYNQLKEEVGKLEKEVQEISQFVDENTNVLDNNINMFIGWVELFKNVNETSVLKKQQHYQSEVDRYEVHKKEKTYEQLKAEFDLQFQKTRDLVEKK